jgi:hypothetical protein
VFGPLSNNHTGGGEDIVTSTMLKNGNRRIKYNLSKNNLRFSDLRLVPQKKRPSHFHNVVVTKSNPRRIYP